MSKAKYTLNGTQLECDGQELRPDGTCVKCERINERISALAEKAYQAGIKEGNAYQALVEIQGRERFLDDVREKVDAIKKAAKNLLSFNLPSEGMPHVGSKAWREACKELRTSLSAKL